MRSDARRARAVVPVLLWALGCGGPEAPLAFVHADVLPMDRERVLRDQTLVVRSGRIERLGPSAEVRVPAGVRRVDAAGTTILPGLADMHVHLQRPARLRGYLAHGVTLVRNMRGTERHLRLRERVARGEIPGPRIVTSGPHLDGRGPSFPGRLVVRDADEARAAVAWHGRLGFDFVKVYSRLSRPAFDAIVAAAAEAGLPVVGHVPAAVGLEAVLASGQRSIEHVEELSGSPPFLFETRRIPEAARRARASGVYVCPTLSTYRTFGPRAEVFQRFHTELVRGLHEAGVPLLLGTDAEGYEVGGAPPVRELRALVGAGLRPYEALLTATREPARFLRLGAGAGTLREGGAADLVVVPGDPLADLGALERPRWVCRAGRCYGPETLAPGGPPTRAVGGAGRRYADAARARMRSR